MSVGTEPISHDRAAPNARPPTRISIASPRSLLRTSAKAQVFTHRDFRRGTIPIVPQLPSLFVDILQSDSLRWHFHSSQDSSALPGS